MKTEKWLPAGSVVLLKESTKKIMIIGYLQARPEDTSKVYDYCACLYPEAYQDANHLYLFNHDQIETIYSVGYIDQEHLAFLDRLNQTARTLV